MSKSSSNKNAGIDGELSADERKSALEALAGAGGKLDADELKAFALGELGLNREMAAEMSKYLLDGKDEVSVDKVLKDMKIFCRLGQQHEHGRAAEVGRFRSSPAPTEVNLQQLCWGEKGGPVPAFFCFSEALWTSARLGAIGRFSEAFISATPDVTTSEIRLRIHPQPVCGGALKQDYPPRRAVAAWMLFDWAAQPYFTLINAFIFAPFFATALAENPADGQAMWGYAAGFAGLIIALISPVLGGVADHIGPRKPWIAGFGLLLVAGSAAMWFAVRATHPPFFIALAAYIIATIGSECATVFNNAMMPGLVPPSRIGRLSGAGWALGYLGGIASLVVMLTLLIASPETGRTMAACRRCSGLIRRFGRGTAPPARYRPVVHRLRAADVHPNAGCRADGREPACGGARCGAALSCHAA